jgi:hypothetical protein
VPLQRQTSVPYECGRRLILIGAIGQKRAPEEQVAPNRNRRDNNHGEEDEHGGSAQHSPERVPEPDLRDQNGKQNKQDDWQQRPLDLAAELDLQNVRSTEKDEDADRRGGKKSDQRDRSDDMSGGFEAPLHDRLPAARRA